MNEPQFVGKERVIYTASNPIRKRKLKMKSSYKEIQDDDTNEKLRHATTKGCNDETNDISLTNN
jgi:hypothetical protein